MDANLAKTERMRVKRVMERLEANAFATAYVETKEDALKLVKQLVPPGSSTATGGSQSLIECGILKYLEDETQHIDRNAPGLSPEEARKRNASIFMADFYLASANAITEHGEVYEVDGRGNRISAIAFGPEKVILVVGVNKIVPSLREAVERVKRVASPANCVRLGKDTYCAKKGICVSPSFDEHDLMCHADCGEDTICCDTLILKRQRIKDRITVVLVGEALGY